MEQQKQSSEDENKVASLTTASQSNILEQLKNIEEETTTKDITEISNVNVVEDTVSHSVENEVKCKTVEEEKVAVSSSKVSVVVDDSSSAKPSETSITCEHKIADGQVETAEVTANGSPAESSSGSIKVKPCFVLLDSKEVERQLIDKKMPTTTTSKSLQNQEKEPEVITLDEDGEDKTSVQKSTPLPTNISPSEEKKIERTKSCKENEKHDNLKEKDSKSSASSMNHGSVVSSKPCPARKKKTEVDEENEQKLKSSDKVRTTEKSIISKPCPASQKINISSSSQDSTRKSSNSYSKDKHKTSPNKEGNSNFKSSPNEKEKRIEVTKSSSDSSKSSNKKVAHSSSNSRKNDEEREKKTNSSEKSKTSKSNEKSKEKADVKRSSSERERKSDVKRSCKDRDKNCKSYEEERNKYEKSGRERENKGKESDKKSDKPYDRERTRSDKSSREKDDKARTSKFSQEREKKSSSRSSEGEKRSTDKTDDRSKFSKSSRDERVKSSKQTEEDKKAVSKSSRDRDDRSKTRESDVKTRTTKQHNEEKSRSFKSSREDETKSRTSRSPKDEKKSYKEDRSKYSKNHEERTSSSKSSIDDKNKSKSPQNEKYKSSKEKEALAKNLKLEEDEKIKEDRRSKEKEDRSKTSKSSREKEELVRISKSRDGDRNKSSRTSPESSKTSKPSKISSKEDEKKDSRTSKDKDDKRKDSVPCRDVGSSRTKDGRPPNEKDEKNCKVSKADFEVTEPKDKDKSGTPSKDAKAETGTSDKKLEESRDKIDISTKPCRVLLDRGEVSRYLFSLESKGETSCRKRQRESSPAESIESDIAVPSKLRTRSSQQETEGADDKNQGNGEDPVLQFSTLIRHYQCDLCPKHYKNAAVLNMHYSKFHKRKMRTYWKPIKYFKCTVCLSVFSDTEISSHIKSDHFDILISKKSNNKCVEKSDDDDIEITCVKSNLTSKTPNITNCVSEEINVKNVDKTSKDESDKAKRRRKLNHYCSNCGAAFDTSTKLVSHEKDCLFSDTNFDTKLCDKNRKIISIDKSDSDSDSVYTVDDSNDSSDSCEDVDDHKIKIDETISKITELKSKCEKLSSKLEKSETKITNVNMEVDILEVPVNKNLMPAEILQNPLTELTKPEVEKELEIVEKTELKVVDNGEKKCKNISEITQEILKPIKIEPCEQNISEVDDLQCKFCSITFNLKQNLDDHYKNYHNFTSVSNDVHSKTTNKTHKDYDKNKKIKSEFKENDALKCGICDLQATDQKSLSKHFEVHVEFDEVLVQLPCLYCDKICKNAVSLGHHIKTSHFPCTTCNIDLKTKEEFRAHIIDHDFGLIKFHICEYCGKECSTLPLLYSHCLDIHKVIDLSLVSTFSVVKEFTKKSNNAPINTLPCPYCEKYYEASSLSHHIKDIHKVLKCHQCNSQYFVKLDSDICKACIMIKQKIGIKFVKCKECMVNYFIPKKPTSKMCKTCRHKLKAKKKLKILGAINEVPTVEQCSNTVNNKPSEMQTQLLPAISDTSMCPIDEQTTEDTQPLTTQKFIKQEHKQHREVQIVKDCLREFDSRKTKNYQKSNNNLIRIENSTQQVIEKNMQIYDFDNSECHAINNSSLQSLQRITSQVFDTHNTKSNYVANDMETITNFQQSNVEETIGNADATDNVKKVLQLDFPILNPNVNESNVMSPSSIKKCSQCKCNYFLQNMTDMGTCKECHDKLVKDEYTKTFTKIINNRKEECKIFKSQKIEQRQQLTLAKKHSYLKSNSKLNKLKGTYLKNTLIQQQQQQQQQSKIPVQRLIRKKRIGKIVNTSIVKQEVLNIQECSQNFMQTTSNTTCSLPSSLISNSSCTQNTMPFTETMFPMQENSMCNTLGSNTIGTSTVGLNTIGPNAMGSNMMGSHTIGLNTVASNTVGLSNPIGSTSIGLNTIGPNTISSTTIGPNITTEINLPSSCTLQSNNVPTMNYITNNDTIQPQNFVTTNNIVTNFITNVGPNENPSNIVQTNFMPSIGTTNFISMSPNVIQTMIVPSNSIQMQSNFVTNGTHLMSLPTQSYNVTSNNNPNNIQGQQNFVQPPTSMVSNFVPTCSFVPIQTTNMMPNFNPNSTFIQNSNPSFTTTSSNYNNGSNNIQTKSQDLYFQANNNVSTNVPSNFVQTVPPNFNCQSGIISPPYVSPSFNSMQTNVMFNSQSKQTQQQQMIWSPTNVNDTQFCNQQDIKTDLYFDSPPNSFEQVFVDDKSWSKLDLNAIELNFNDFQLKSEEQTY